MARTSISSAQARRLAHQFHADQLGQALVHRIDGDGGGLQPVDVFIARQGGGIGETAHRQPVGLRLALEQLLGLHDELPGDLGRLLAAGVVGLGIQRRHAGLLRIGVGHVAAQALAAKDDAETVLLDRLDKDLDAGDFHFAQFDGQRGALLAGNAAGAAVGDVAGRIERDKIATHGNVLGPQLEAHAGRLQGPAADRILQRIVAEQAQVSRAAAGGNAGQNGNRTAQRADFCQGVQVGRLGGLQLGRSARLQGQSPQAVGHQEHDLGVVLDLQFANQLLDFHGRIPRIAGSERFNSPIDSENCREDKWGRGNRIWEPHDFSGRIPKCSFTTHNTYQRIP